jgi:hypothetical protein
MDDRRFDELVRSLSREASRRGVVRAAAGMITGGVLASAKKVSAADRLHCKADGGKCSQADQCCGGACCDGVCTTIFRDSDNCGTCGHVCADDEICAGGHCCKAPDAVCSSDEECCGFACVNGRCCTPTGGECANLYPCCNLFCEPAAETPGFCA